MSRRAIYEAVEKRRDEIVEFAKRLVRTPSPTGHEAQVAMILKQKMEAEGYSEVFIDRVGNVVGIVKGHGGGRSLLYNGHMDHVLPGEMKTPYSAEILDGGKFGLRGPVIYGRGIVDMKGALAAMTIAGSVLVDMGCVLKGDLMLAGTVFEEELGNVGPPALIEMDRLKPAAVLVGECTDLGLAHANRGVVRTRVKTYGKSCHVSVQERGVNALYKMAELIRRIEDANKNLPSSAVLGRASWGICKLDVRPNTVNVVPDLCEAEIDTRSIPVFTPQMVVDRQHEIIEDLRNKDPEFQAEVSVIEKEIETWTGYKTKVRPAAFPFYIDPTHWLVKAGMKSIKHVIKRQPKLRIWGFTTECYCFAERGIPTIGFGPGEERFTHCSEEVLLVEDLVTAAKVYAELAARICGLQH
jgi:putative selenium metabolism hydrolase